MSRWLTVKRLAKDASNFLAAARERNLRFLSPAFRLLEVLLHAGTALGGLTAREIHESILDRFQLRPERYNLNSLRYDLRKLKGRQPGKRQRNGFGSAELEHVRYGFKHVVGRTVVREK